MKRPEPDARRHRARWVGALLGDRRAPRTASFHGAPEVPACQGRVFAPAQMDCRSQDLQSRGLCLSKTWTFEVAQDSARACSLDWKLARPKGDQPEPPASVVKK
uniref:Uncharacterized protein n=1 Tax=Sphaerodactylus townsendi TaxID=933632 RepID=A0ACB8FJM1_9SAUR